MATPDLSPSPERSLSVSAYARARGLTHSAVQRAIADGRVVRGVVQRKGMRPRILASIADAEWRERTSPAHARAGANGRDGQKALAAPDDYRRSLVIEKVVKTKLAQIRLDEQQGRLIDAVEAGHTQFEIARLVRNQLQELPDRLADELALESDAHRVREILVHEIEDILRKLALRLGGATAGSAAPPPTTAAASVAQMAPVAPVPPVASTEPKEPVHAQRA